MSEKINNIRNLILIIIFAILFSIAVQDGIRLVVQKILEIPDDHIGLSQWGEIFFLRIFASLIGTATGAFVIGTFLKKKAKLAAIIAVLPTTIFWIVTLILGISMFREYEYTFKNVKMMLLQPGILAVLTPIVGYHSAGWGQTYLDQFQRPKSVLNIKWYNWIWILPIYLNKVVAIPLFALILLWTLDAKYGSNSYFMEFFDLILNWGYYVARIIILFIFIGLLSSVNHVYSLLAEEESTSKINWKNGMMILGHVLLFLILYVLLFAPQI